MFQSIEHHNITSWNSQHQLSQIKDRTTIMDLQKENQELMVLYEKYVTICRGNGFLSPLWLDFARFMIKPDRFLGKLIKTFHF
jgi:hypothetical protein